MLKKYYMSLLILSLLNFTGCHYSEVIQKSDLVDGQIQLDFKQDLYCTTQDSTRYHFLPGNYHAANDSLFGKGEIESSSPITPFQGYIPLNDLISVEQKKVDSMGTIGLVLGIVLTGLLVFSAIFGGAFADSLNPD